MRFHRARLCVGLLLALGSLSQVLAAENFSGKTLENRDFSGKDLREANFSDATLKGCNFHRAILDGASFEGADVRGCSFYEARAPRGNFKGLVVAPGTGFGSANFEGADFRGVDFKGVGFEGTSFRGADLRNTSGWGTSAHVNFRGADLRGANLTGTSGYGGKEQMDFKLKGAKYDARTILPEGFDPKEEGALLAEADEPARTASSPDGARPASSKGEPGEAPAPASGASPVAVAALPPQEAPASSTSGYVQPDSGVSLKGKDLSRKDFSNQYLNGANLEATDLTFTRFYGAKLKKASFRGADVIQTSFDQADLTEADFSKAVIDRATFAGARLNGANLEGQTLHLAGSRIFFKVPDGPLSYEQRELAKLAMSGHTHNNALSLKGANLRNAVVFGDLDTVDFRKTDLRGADLSGCERAEPRFFAGVKYDSRTRFPPDIDPERVGAVRGEDVAPPTGQARASSASPVPGPSPREPEPARPAEPPAPAARAAGAAEPAPSPAAKAPESFGMAGFFWRLADPGSGGAARLLYVYPDGSYSWSQDGGKSIDRTWEPARDAASSILLHEGEGGDDWVAAVPSQGRIVLKSRRSGRSIEGSKGDPVR